MSRYCLFWIFSLSFSLQFLKCVCSWETFTFSYRVFRSPPNQPTHVGSYKKKKKMIREKVKTKGYKSSNGLQRGNKWRFVWILLLVFKEVNQSWFILFSFNTLPLKLNHKPSPWIITNKEKKIKTKHVCVSLTSRLLFVCLFVSDCLFSLAVRNFHSCFPSNLVSLCCTVSKMNYKRERYKEADKSFFC